MLKHLLFRLLTICVCACSLNASALVVRPRVLYGIGFNPATLVASTSDVWSIFNNPAGTAFVQEAEFGLGYQYQWRGPATPLNYVQALASYNIFDMVTFDLAGNLQMPNNYSLTEAGEVGGTLSVAYHYYRLASVGVSLFKSRNFSQPWGFVPIWMAGAQARPFWWMSLGFVITQIYENYISPFSPTIGVTFKPGTENIMLGWDNPFVPHSEEWRDGFYWDPRFAIRASYKGIIMAASITLPDLAHGFQAPVLTGGIEVNTDYFGITPNGGGVPNNNGYVGFRARMSTHKWESVVPQKPRFVSFRLTKNGVLPDEDTSFISRFWGQKPLDSLSLLSRIHDIALDDSVEGVVLKFENLNLSFPRAQEMRQTLIDIRNSGKKVVVYLVEPDEQAYLVATAADRIYLQPSSQLQVNAFRNTMMFVKKTLSKIGISAQEVHAGRYKSYPRMFTADKPNQEQLQVAEHIVDSRYQTFIKAISASRHMDEKTTLSLIDKGVLTADEAKSSGLVDELLQPYEVDKKVVAESGFMLVGDKAYLSNSVRTTKWAPDQAIAIIPIEGTIVLGPSRSSLLPSMMGANTGSDDVVALLDAAASNPLISSIVVRIDSPGGNAIASDIIFQAIKNASMQKPVVVSMGSVAASGGYFAALGGHTIFAEGTTLTGSIGVWSMHFSIPELAKKIGLTHFTVEKGKNTTPGLLEPMSKERLEREQVVVDATYMKFKQTVAAQRHLTLEQVEAAAQGRIWTGEEALSLRLIDAIGGLPDAIAKARALTNTSESENMQVLLLQKDTWNPFSLSSLFSFDAKDAFIDATEKPMAMAGQIGLLQE